MQGNFYIKTFGCQMNVADTDRMAALLRDAGMNPIEDVNHADLILINGCSVREKPVHKAVSALGALRPLTQKGSDGPLIGLGGCVGQLEKDKIFKSAPFLDFVFGPDAIDELPEIVQRVREGDRQRVFTDFDDRSKKYSTETKVFGDRAQAFVNIMKGCDKFCTYCIVPFTRGREKSRTIDEVVEDVAGLVSQGVREVTLLGQNVNSFGKGSPNLAKREPIELSSPIGKVGPRDGEENFPQLLYALDRDPRCKDLRRIRFTSSHPLDFSDELVECYRPASEGGVARLAKHLHLPVQSGSNSVLKRMGRHHQIENYYKQMERLREICPEVGLSTDIIVGFPGETEEEFQETVGLLDRIQFDSIYAFAYSPRPGTKADKMEDDVPDAEKNRRLNFLLDHQKSISKKKYEKNVGKKFEVLIEGPAKSKKIAGDRPGLLVWTGRTTCNRVVNFQTMTPRNLKGKFIDVEIDKSTSLALYGSYSPELEAGGAQQ